MESKLPGVGTTIFTQMSALAAEHGAINLSQGYPDFDAPDALLDRVQHYLRGGHNQYAPMTGVPALRAALQSKVRESYAVAVSDEHEITVTSGATEALFCAIAAVVRPGDEVVVFDPAYDSYEPAIALQGGITRHVPLGNAPGFAVDWQRVADTVNAKTRLIVINTPHNPTGMIWQQHDIDQLRELVANTHILLLSDEVYEHMVFDHCEHLSLCRYPDLYARSFVVSSLGKTYHATGWKIGYCVAPRALSVEFRKVHQYVTFTSITPVQQGLADYIESHPAHYQGLSAFYQAKRDFMVEALAPSRLKLTPSQGTYFQMVDYGELTQDLDQSVARYWTTQVGVAAIPISGFYAEPPQATLLRLCFAKEEATLRLAAERLCQL